MNFNERFSSIAGRFNEMASSVFSKGLEDNVRASKSLSRNTVTVPVYSITKDGMRTETNKTAKIAGIIGWAVENIPEVFAVSIPEVSPELRPAYTADFVRGLESHGLNLLAIKTSWWIKVSYSRPLFVVVATDSGFIQLERVLRMKLDTNFIQNNPEKASTPLCSPTVKGVFGHTSITVMPEVPDMDGAAIYCEGSKLDISLQSQLCSLGHGGIKTGQAFQARGRVVMDNHNYLKGLLFKVTRKFFEQLHSLITKETGTSLELDYESVLTTTDFAKKTVSGQYKEATVLINEFSSAHESRNVRLGIQPLSRQLSDSWSLGKRMARRKLHRILHAIQESVKGNMEPLLKHLKKVDLDTMDDSIEFRGAPELLWAFQSVGAANSFNSGSVGKLFSGLVKDAFGVDVRGTRSYSCPAYFYKAMTGKNLEAGYYVPSHKEIKAFGDHVIVKWRNPVGWGRGIAPFRAIRNNEWFFHMPAFGYGKLTRQAFGEDYDGDDSNHCRMRYFIERPATCRNTWRLFWEALENDREVESFANWDGLVSSSHRIMEDPNDDIIKTSLFRESVADKVGLADTAITYLRFMDQHPGSREMCFLQSVLDCKKHSKDIPDVPAFISVYSRGLDRLGLKQWANLLNSAKSGASIGTLVEKYDEAIVEGSAPLDENNFLQSMTLEVVEFIKTMNPRYIPKWDTIEFVGAPKLSNAFLIALMGTVRLRRTDYERLVRNNNSLVGKILWYVAPGKGRLDADNTTITEVLENHRIRISHLIEYVNGLSSIDEFSTERLAGAIGANFNEREIKILNSLKDELIPFISGDRNIAGAIAYGILQVIGTGSKSIVPLIGLKMINLFLSILPPVRERMYNRR